MAKTAASPAQEQRTQRSAHEILESREFKALVARRWAVSALLLAALFVTYYGYILLVATSKELLSTRIGAVTTLAIPVGAGVIVVAFVLTAIYVRWANGRYDPEVDRLKRQLRDR
jgi:uncharacterized membrane protein (DUF485 family)